eukprot:m.668872 g.668872  ORF g.668872 m.668872 type:complete len:62 (-) comp22758_c0_seq1:448-633(-)
MPRTTPPHPPHTTLANVKVNMAAADVAIVTYVRLTQAVAQSGAVPPQHALQMGCYVCAAVK